MAGTRRRQRRRGNPLGIIASSFINGLGAGAGFTAMRAALGGEERLMRMRQMQNPLGAGDVVRLAGEAARVFGDTAARVVRVSGGGLFGGPARVELVTPSGVRGTVSAAAVKQANPRDLDYYEQELVGGRFSSLSGTPFDPAPGRREFHPRRVRLEGKDEARWAAIQAATGGRAKVHQFPTGGWHIFEEDPTSGRRTSLVQGTSSLPKALEYALEEAQRTRNPARYALTVRTRRLPAAEAVRRTIERYGGEAVIRPFADPDEYGHRYLVGVTKRPAPEALRELARRFNPVPATSTAANPMNANLAAARARFNSLVRVELAKLSAAAGSARAKFRLAALRAKARYRAGE